MSRSLDYFRGNPEMKPSDTIIAWVDDYSDDLYAWAYTKTKDKELAQDIVQDTFLAALQQIEKFSQRSHPKTWLFAILNNKIADVYRKRKHIAVLDNDTQESSDMFTEDGMWKSEYMPTEWYGESNLLDNPEFIDVWEQCLQRLPEKWLTTVEITYFEKKYVQDDSNVILSKSNYWQILHKSRLQLRKCLEFHWFKP